MSEQLEKAERAIAHVLEQIRTNPKVRYEMGFASKSFQLLTEAAAAIWGEPLESIQDYYLRPPLHPIAPIEGARGCDLRPRSEDTGSPIAGDR